MLVSFASLLFLALGMASGDFQDACADLHTIFRNQSSRLDAKCENILAPHSNSVSGGYCLASMVSAGYYRSSIVNPLYDAVVEISGTLGLFPVITGTNSGGTMFIVRYFALRDTAQENLWTYPCYLLKTGYRTTCFLHGNFGSISEECYSENQNLIGAATGMIYSQLIQANGGPLGAVASYASVYFSFLNNLPISREDTSYAGFWKSRGQWNTREGIQAEWTVAHTVVSPLEASQGENNWNYGYSSYLSRGFYLDSNGFSKGEATQWFANTSVYTVSSISANTLSAISMQPFSFAGKAWDNSADSTGASVPLKLLVC